MRLSEMAGLNKMHSNLKGVLNVGSMSRAQYIRIENNGILSLGGVNNFNFQLI